MAHGVYTVCGKKEAMVFSA